MARRKITYGDASRGAPYVSIYCDGHDTDQGPSHGGQRWRIATFIPGADGWKESVAYTTADGATLDLGTSQVTTYLVAQRVVDRDEAWRDPAGLRARIRLHCRVCGLTEVARHERLSVAVERLHVADVREVSLVGIGAILRSR